MPELVWVCTHPVLHFLQSLLWQKGDVTARRQRGTNVRVRELVFKYLSLFIRECAWHLISLLGESRFDHFRKNQLDFSVSDRKK